MEKLKLKFDANIDGQSRELVVEVPYQDGIVATSEFCPTDFMSGSIDLMAAIRGETLDQFMADCRMQIHAMSKVTEATSDMDVHIGALMAVVLDLLSRDCEISFGRVLILVDCFCLLLAGAGVSREKVMEIYPSVTLAILSLYPESFVDVPESVTISH